MISVIAIEYLRIGLEGRVFADGSIPGRVILKTLKMVLDTSLLNPQQYNVRIDGKVEQFTESVVATEKIAFWSPSTTLANLQYL